MKETLAAYVTRVMTEKRLSSYDVERNSGKTISQSHVYRISTGEVKQPGPNVLKALAKGLGVAEGEVFAVARGITEDSNVIADERLQRVSEIYLGLVGKARSEADYLIDMLEREFHRLSSEKERQTSTNSDVRGTANGQGTAPAKRRMPKRRRRSLKEKG